MEGESANSRNCSQSGKRPIGQLAPSPVQYCAPSARRGQTAAEYPRVLLMRYIAVVGVENRDNGIHTASVAARYAGKRPTLSGFAARTANSRHSDAPVRQCWISTAFGLMTNTLRARQRQSQRLRLPPRTLRLG